MKYKYLFTIILVVFLLSFSVVLAVTKPPSDSDMESWSYVFYLYYNNGQLFADRDYQIKFDVINERFVSETVRSNAYKVEILNSKSEAKKTSAFDPQKGDPNFKAGKVQVKAPYVPEGERAVFYNSQGQPLVTIFVQAGSLCNNNGICSSVDGENEKMCPSDCKKATPKPTVAPITAQEEGLDLYSILIYVVGGAGVALAAWFGWKWWKKRKEESFLPPPPPPLTPPSSLPPGFPPLN